MTDQDRNTGSDDLYFAAKAPEEVASVMLNRARSFYNALNSNSYLDKLVAMWQFYNGYFNTKYGFSHTMEFVGEQGEIVSLPVNHFRNIAQHIYNMITATRPAMQARAVNNDYKSLAQTTLANDILDYYMREKYLESGLKKAVEMAIVLGAGYLQMEWNATAGEAYDVDEATGHFNYEGELEFTNLSPLDVVFDGTKESWNHEWILVRKFQNRYNLMAKYPELAEKIKTIPSKSDMSVYRLALFSNDETDDIPIYEFYHKRTEAIPDGRYILFIDNDCVLLDTKLPYRVLPIFRIVPNEILGTPYGYSPMFDVYPIQEAINALYSTIMTNQNAFGVQNLWVKDGEDIQVTNYEGALNIIKGQTKPEPLQLTHTAPETFNFLNMLIQAAETVSGVNSVTRGQPEANLRSGNALALVQAMSLQYISGLQQSYVRLIEDVGTSLIQILKDFSTTPKVIALVGKNNRPLLKEFTGEQINSINRVIVDMGNPLARTTAGRVQMAEQLLQMQLIKNPEQYFQVINTGRLDTTYQGETGQLLLTQRENERLMEGRTVTALFTDNHKLHIEEHASVLNDPELREDGDETVITNTAAHIQAHIDLLRNTDPDTLIMLGQQPLQSPAPMMPDVQTPGMTPAPGMEGLMQQPPGGDQGANMVQSQTGGQVLPLVPEVPGELLPNPELQQNALGNVK